MIHDNKWVGCICIIWFTLCVTPAWIHAQENDHADSLSNYDYCINKASTVINPIQQAFYLSHAAVKALDFDKQKSKQLMEQSLHIVKTAETPQPLMAAIFFNFGEVNYFLDNFDEAVAFFLKSHDLAIANKDNIQSQKSLFEIADVYNYTGKNDSFLVWFLKAEKAMPYITDKDIHQMYLYQKFCINIQINNYDVLDTIIKKIEQEIPSQMDLADSIHYGNFYYAMYIAAKQRQDWDKTQEYISKSIQYTNAKNITAYLPLLSNYIYYFLNTKQYDEVIKRGEILYSQSKEHQDYQTQKEVLIKLIHAYSALQKQDEAKARLHDYYNNLGQFYLTQYDRERFCSAMVEFHKAAGNYDSVHYYAIHQLKLLDTQNNSRIQDIYAQQRLLLEVKESEKELEKTMSESRQKKQLFWLIILSIVLVGIVIFFRLKQLLSKIKARTMLEEMVKQSTEQLITTNRQLEKANMELQQFAHHTALNIHEPLRNVISFSSLIIRDIGKGTTDTLQEYASFIRQATNRMTLLMRDSLDFIRLQEPISQYSRIDFSILQRQIEKEIQQMNKSVNYSIQWKDMPQNDVFSVPTYLEKVFFHLIQNGITYNDSDLKTIEIHSKQTGKWLHFYVTDNGKGVEPMFREEIFSMFKRFYKGQSTAGTGLGLTICQKIMSNLNGKIDIHSASTDNAGSTFVFSIPIDNN